MRGESTYHAIWYVPPPVITSVAVWLPLNVIVPLKLNDLPEVDAPPMVTAPLPDIICCVVLLTCMLVDVIVSVLVKVFLLPIFDCSLPLRV